MSNETDFTSAAANIVAAAAIAAGGDRGKMMDKIAELTVLAADVAPAIAAASNVVSSQKFPQTVRGIIKGVEGNCVSWSDVGPDAKKDHRQAFVGNDPVSRHAARRAGTLVGRECRISFGWTRGMTQQGETDIRRLLRVVPIAQASSEPASQGQRPRSANMPPAEREDAQPVETARQNVANAMSAKQWKEGLAKIPAATRSALKEWAQTLEPPVNIFNPSETEVPALQAQLAKMNRAVAA